MSIQLVPVYSPEAKATGTMGPVLSCRISVGDAVAMAIGHISVQPHQGVEDEEDVEDVEGEEEEMQAPDNRPNRMLPCMCRMQVFPDLLCNRSREQAQCPLNNRETE